MDTSCTSAVWPRGFRPQGKVRRRVQDLRTPFISYYGYVSSRPTLDLSHNKSARLAVDSLLSHSLKGYQEVLKAEGEVDFLSELEKSYILQNMKDGSTADPGASDVYDVDDDDDDDDSKLDSLSGDSQSATRCPATSTDSDPTVTGLDLSNLKDVRRTDCVMDESNIEVYFQSDSRAVSMKDLVREFIRKAQMALAIVMDSFSDVELLCDLLEASRRRNVSVHLLLDHLNLNLFVSMWQELKLNSKDFPKLSVRSIDGQTYCAKTGRKLTGQIAESFIITDWNKVLTGSFSFSWLSWQVHRSLAVLVKGSVVIPFHQEFHRLYTSSKPVAGFVTYISVPHTVLQHTMIHAAQNKNADVSKSKSSQAKTVCHQAWKEDAQNTQTKTEMPVSFNPQSLKSECSKADTQPLHRAGTGTQMNEKPPQLYPNPLVQSGVVQSVSVGKQKHTVGGVCPQHGAQINVKPLEKNKNQIQSHSNPLSQTHVTYVQPQFTNFTVTPTAEKNVIVQESNLLHTASPAHGQHRTVCFQSPFRTNSNREHNVVTEGLFFRQRNRDRLINALGTAAGLNTQRQQWYCSPNFTQKVDFLDDHPKVQSPSTSMQKQAKANHPLSSTHPRGHIPWIQTKVSSLESRKQDHPQRHHQPPPQSYPTTDAPVSASTVMGTHYKPQLQLDSKLFSPTGGGRIHLKPHSSQQVKPTPRLNWMPQSRTARPKPVARHSSFNNTYGTGQLAINTSLGRNKSINYGHFAGFKGAGLNPNKTMI